MQLISNALRRRRSAAFLASIPRTCRELASRRGRSARPAEPPESAPASLPAPLYRFDFNFQVPRAGADGSDSEPEPAEGPGSSLWSDGGTAPRGTPASLPTHGADGQPPAAPFPGAPPPASPPPPALPPVWTWDPLGVRWGAPPRLRNAGEEVDLALDAPRGAGDSEAGPGGWLLRGVGAEELARMLS